MHNQLPSTPPTKPFSHQLHTYTSTNAPVPYPVKPPSFLHTLLPHILPPLLALYPNPNNPPKTLMALHLYTLVSQHGDKKNLQKSEKDLMWYDVLCCIEAGSFNRARGTESSRSSISASNERNDIDDSVESYEEESVTLSTSSKKTHSLKLIKRNTENNYNIDYQHENEFWPIWNAFNGKGDIIERNMIFMDWAREYMERYELNQHNSLNTSPYSSRESIAKTQLQDIPFENKKFELNHYEDEEIKPIVTRGKILGVPSSIDDKNNKNQEKNKYTLKGISTNSSREITNEIDTESKYITQNNFHLENGLLLHASQDENDKSIRNSTNTSFPLDYAKRISEKVSQLYVENKLNRSIEEQNKLQSKSNNENDLKSRRNIHISSLSIDDHDPSLQNTSFIPNNKELEKIPSTGEINQNNLSKKSSENAWDSKSSPTSSTFVKILMYPQSPSVRSLSEGQSHTPQVKDDISNPLVDSPEKSHILESYLKASGDDILETASSFIDKFYDDIVSPASKKQIFHRKNSSSSLYSHRSRLSYADNNSKRDTNSLYEHGKQVLSDNTTDSYIDKMHYQRNENEEMDSSSSSITPLNDHSSQGTLQDNKSNEKPEYSENKQIEFTKENNEEIIGKEDQESYEELVHEYWTNYKSIMMTAKWKAEVIDLIAETRAEYELEKLQSKNIFYKSA